MAYAALVSLAKTIDLILNYRQDYISPQVKNQLVFINEYVIFMQAFLEDLPEKANSFEGRIREITHVAEDIIEFLLSDALDRTVRSLKSKFKYRIRRRWKQIHSLGSSKSKFKRQPKGKYEHLRFDFQELKEVTGEIESIAEEVMEIKNSIIVKDARRGDSTAASSSSRAAPTHKDAMVGFEIDQMEIKSRLCGESSKLEVIPIVGMGGIGKTTLAKNAYDDPLIMEHFHIRAWATVSQDYSVHEIILGLLVSMKELDAKNESMKQHHVYQKLKGRRYLIVLDDIWSTKAWDDLKMMFPDDSNGSRIIFTTRLLDVASYIDSFSPLHEMQLMDEDRSWNLLRYSVFKMDPCPAELEYVGKMIAISCRGLPLALVVISGLLSTVDQTKTAWKNISDNVKSAISANDEQFDKILSLSYTRLPHHLRPCFLYMGGFPEDYKMRVSKLIKLWVAEGFLKPNGSKSFEETAEEYLEDLVKRSLVLVTNRKSNGRIKCVSIHDLMREMCMRNAQEENFFLHVSRLLRKGVKIPRRVSIIHSDLDFLEKNGSTIRTIMRLEHSQGLTRCSFGYFRLLRILDLLNSCELFHTAFPSLPFEVFELFHLRYLAFDYPFEIPAAISNLQNLQTLIIGPSNYYDFTPTFVNLPVEIWRLPQLRHLILFCHLLPFPEATSALEKLQSLLVARNFKNLQTLSVVANFVCTQNILKMIPNLKKLGICYTADEEIYEEDCQLHNLVYLQQLEILKLKICNHRIYPKKVNPAFPSTLKRLTLSGLGLPWKDLNIVGSLPNLEVLKLRDDAYDGDAWETTEGEFSELKFLLIDKSDLRFWITASSHFPRLKCLVLRRCQYLSNIPDGIAEIPTLELIEVDGLNKSLEHSAKQIQVDQQNSGNDAFQVHTVNKRWWTDY